MSLTRLGLLVGLLILAVGLLSLGGTGSTFGADTEDLAVSIPTEATDESIVASSGGSQLRILPENETIAFTSLNVDSTFEFDEVLLLTNEGDDPLTVRVTHDQPRFDAYANPPSTTRTLGTATDGAPPLETDGVDLQPGDAVSVGFRIDTTGTAPGDSIEARLDIETTGHDGGSGGDSGSGDDGESCCPDQGSDVGQGGPPSEGETPVIVDDDTRDRNDGVPFFTRSSAENPWWSVLVGAVALFVGAVLAFTLVSWRRYW